MLAPCYPPCLNNHTQKNHDVCFLLSTLSQQGRCHSLKNGEKASEDTEESPTGCTHMKKPMMLACYLLSIITIQKTRCLLPVNHFDSTEKNTKFTTTTQNFTMVMVTTTTHTKKMLAPCYPPCLKEHTDRPRTTLLFKAHH